MRHTKVVLSKSADATGGYTVVMETPKWANNLLLTVYGDDDTDSTQSSFAIKLFHCSLYPGLTTGAAAATVSTTTGGSSTQSEVQTVKFNGTSNGGYPPFGSFALTFPDDTVTAYIPCVKGTGMPKAEDVQRIINQAYAAAGAKTAVAVTAVGTPPDGTDTQTIYTITYGGARALSDVAAVTVDTTKLMIPTADTATNFLDFGGTTAVTTQSTSEYAHILIGPGVTGIADDSTAHVYKLNGPLPSFIGLQSVTDVATDTACTYTYQVVGEYTS